MQDAGLTYQQFKNCTDNLNAWLERLPHNKVRPSDGPSQIAYKLQAQKVRSWGCRGCGPASPPASYPELSPQARPSSLAAFLTGRAACARVARPLVASVLMTSKLRPQRLCFLHHHPRHSKSLKMLHFVHGGSDSNGSAYNAGDLGSIPGSGRSPGEGNGNPLQYSCLENSMEGEAW